MPVRKIPQSPEIADTICEVSETIWAEVTMMQSSSTAATGQTPGERAHWLTPEGLCSRLDLGAGMTIADLSAGTGFFAVPLARRAGSGAKVWAVESDSVLAATLRAALSQPDAPANLEVLAGSPARTQLPDASCDLVLLADLWGRLENRDAVLAEAKRILKEGGRLVLLDWKPESPSPAAPPVEQRTSMHSAICALEMNSWSLDKAEEIGADGYLLIFEPTDESVQS
jgi:ubiquinone/menaquinone biosynthesis C-methylase UbiE